MTTINKYTPFYAHKENTENLEKDYIHFTEPYYRIAGKEQFKNQELNEVLSQSIYSSLQDNYDYIAQTQHNTNKDNKYKVRKIERALDKITKRNRSIPFNNFDIYNPKEGYINNSNSNSQKVLNNYELKKLIKENSHLKTHNILKNNIDNIEIIHYIPPLNTQEEIQIENIQNLSNLSNQNINQNINNNIENKMYNPRYNNNMNNEYPPMNGLNYKNMLSNNNEGYYAKTNHNNNQMNNNPLLQQQNIHGRNDLLFPDGCPTYGFYDQSNFIGTNTLMCGQDIQNHRNASRNNINNNMYRNDYNNNMPMSYGNMYPQHLNNNLNNNKYYNNIEMNNMNGQGNENMYTHEVSYGPENLIQKNNANNNSNNRGNNSVSGKDRKDLNRKNMSKLKKGMIDINIETSSSNRQGVCIDLNIGVGN